MTQPLNKNPKKKLYTIDEYHKMAEAGIIAPHERVELIKGEILNKNSVSSNHASINSRINHFFISKFLRKTIVGNKSPIRIDNYSLIEPDICLLKPLKDFYSKKHPQPKDTFLIIEVSDTTLAFDKNIKLPIYAEARIPEYWIIDVNENQILAHSIPEGKQYKKVEIANLNDSISCKQFPDISFAVRDILG